MTDNELEKIRSKYEKLLSTKKALESLQEEKKFLENNVKVKRYLEITNLLENNKENNSSLNYDNLIERSINSIPVSNTNNIYVYIGTYRYNDEIDIIHGSKDDRVAFFDKKADYRVYRNIESLSYQDDYSINVPVSQCEKFEREHNVIYPKTCLNGEYYYKVRREFFKTAILEGQEKAIEKVLTKKEKNN